MESYRLYVDNKLIHSGSFYTDTILDGFVNFGDGAQVLLSGSEWDYFRFGTIPEPTSLTLFPLLAATFRNHQAFVGNDLGEDGSVIADEITGAVFFVGGSLLNGMNVGECDQAITHARGSVHARARLGA